MRDLLLVTALCATASLLAGCVDAPLTPAHLDPDGQRHGARMEQSAFAAEVDARHHAAIQVTAVLATQPEGPLADAADFSAEDPAIYLHLRADRLATPRPVTFAWIHQPGPEAGATDGATPAPEIFEEEGVLAPSTTLTMASGHHLSDASVGAWRVEIRDRAVDGAPLTLFTREFTVRPRSAATP